MTTEQDVILVERRGPVEWITLNRPDRLNAITATMANALADRFASLQEDHTVRVVVLRGSGRAFCAGLDVKELPSEGNAAVGLSRMSEIVLNIQSCPQPVIALLQGAACGGGFAFALAADIRIAGESARMNDAFVNLGLSGCELGMSYFLPRQLGTSVAAELMFTGRFLEATRALQLGLVSAVVPDIELESAAEDLIRDMLLVTPLGLRKTKETLRRLLHEDDLSTVLKMEMATQQECMRGPDFQEGIQAIKEKRAPNFTGT